MSRQQSFNGSSQRPGVPAGFSQESRTKIRRQFPGSEEQVVGSVWIVGHGLALEVP
jgi:hypothetical protein